VKVQAMKVTVCALTLWIGAGVALAQTCGNSVPDPMQNSRYDMKADGTVVDRYTGLMWMRCAIGQAWDSNNQTCTGTATTFTWQDALNKVQTLDSSSSSGFAGYKDWRLPNERELTSLVRYACSDPAINEAAFPATPSVSFWTSTPVASSYGLGWGVDFKTGQAYYVAYSQTSPIRLVRAGAFAY